MPRPEYKTCSRCDAEKATSEFYWQNVCQREATKLRREADIERVRARDRAYYMANREERKAKDKAYYQANRKERLAKAKTYRELNGDVIRAAEREAYAANLEARRSKAKRHRERNLEAIRAMDRARWARDRTKRSQQKRDHYQRNKERLKAERSWAVNPRAKSYQLKYREANRDKILEQARAARYKRRALMAELYVEDVPLDDVLLRDLGICGICAKPILESTVELDHIIPLAAGGAHERTNIQLAHRSCNRQKFTKLDFSLAS
jgi:5-methylcytosine-specific restriction endonuclease McrA